MINEITRHLPNSLSKIMLVEFDRQRREVQYVLRADSEMSQFWFNRSDVIDSLLALAVFYNHILMPLKGAEGTIRRFMRYDVESINLGSFRISANDAERISALGREFNGILHKHGIDKAMLEQSDARSFLDFARDAFDK